MLCKSIGHILELDLEHRLEQDRAGVLEQGMVEELVVEQERIYKYQQ